MEKKKRLNKVMLFIVILYSVVFFLLLLLQILSFFLELAFSVAPILYWLILIGWIYSIWNFRLKSSHSLLLALILFFLAGVTTVLGFEEVGETVMRLSFIGWVVGITQALIEYKKVDEKGNTS